MGPFFFGDAVNTQEALERFANEDEVRMIDETKSAERQSVAARILFDDVRECEREIEKLSQSIYVWYALSGGLIHSLVVDVREHNWSFVAVAACMLLLVGVIVVTRRSRADQLRQEVHDSTVYIAVDGVGPPTPAEMRKTISDHRANKHLNTQ